MDGIADILDSSTLRTAAAARTPRPWDGFWRMAALTVAPIMIFAVAALTLLAVRDKDLREAALTRTAIAFTTEIDRAFAGQAAGLTALSASDTLDHDDFAGFYREASRVVAMQPDWVTIILSDPATGQQLVNTLRPLGSPLPVFPYLEAYQRAVKEKAPVFVARPEAVGPTTARPVYGMHAPAVREGDVKYMLSATFSEAMIKGLLTRTRLPADVHGLIVSESGRLIARIAEGGTVTLTTGAAAEVLPPEFFAEEDAAAVAPVSGWSVHLKRGLWSEITFGARRLWLIAAAGVVSIAVGLFSLFMFMEQRKRAEGLLESRVQERTRELAAAAAQQDALLEELHHRVNNNLQIVGSLVRLQERDAKGTAGAGPLKILRERLGSLFTVHREIAGPMPTVEIGRALTQVSDAVVGRIGAAALSGTGATVRRDPALIAGVALCEFLRPVDGAPLTAADGAAVHLTVAQRQGLVEITVTQRLAPNAPPLPQERADLILLLADQGRRTARIENGDGERRLVMQVHPAP